MRIVDPHYFYLIISELLVNDFDTTFLIFPDHLDNKLHGQACGLLLEVWKIQWEYPSSVIQIGYSIVIYPHVHS
jgi:hypothetical protein